MTLTARPDAGLTVRQVDKAPNTEAKVLQRINEVWLKNALEDNCLAVFSGGQWQKVPLTTEHHSKRIQYNLSAVIPAHARCISDLDGTHAASEPALISTGIGAAAEWLRLHLLAHKPDEYADPSSFCLTDGQIADIRETCFGVADDVLAKNIFDWIQRNFQDEISIRQYAVETFKVEYMRIREGLYREASRAGQVKMMPGSAEIILAVSEQYGQISINTGSARAFADLSLDEAIQKALIIHELRNRDLVGDDFNPDPQTIKELLATEDLAFLRTQNIFPKEMRVFSSELPKGATSKPDSTGYNTAKARMSLQQGSSWFGFVDRANDLCAAIGAGASVIVVVPEDMVLKKFFGANDFQQYLEVLNPKWREKGAEPGNSFSPEVTIVFASSLEHLCFEPNLFSGLRMPASETLKGILAKFNTDSGVGEGTA